MSRVVVAAAAAVSAGDVEVSVHRTEGDPAAVVVRLGLADRQQHQLAGLVGVIGRRRRNLEARSPKLIAGSGVADVEEAVALEVGVEGQAQQTLLVVGIVDARLDVEEGAAQ